MGWVRECSLRVLVLGVVVAVCLTSPVPEDTTPKCGYESCPKPKPGMLNVHLVPHSHDDVGWLKTVDQYYYGSNSLIQRAGVQYILDSVITELQNDPNKKFIQVETAFFAKWWSEQHDAKRHLVQRLVRDGQLEFIGGAWSMNDEAVTNYQSIVDQFTWGYRFLNDTFGKCGQPKVAWQIDPFGHSRTFATLLAQMGIDGVFLGRIDWQDKANRLEKRTPEMIWKTSPNLGNSADLFTGVLYNFYAPPPGFCFDDLCSDDPIIDDKRSPDYNVDAKVEDFVYYVKTQAANYSTNNIILTMGEDFHYQAAGKWFTNMDKLIRYVNNKQGINKVNVFYSTPSCYLKALNDLNKTWPTKEDDFFPYSSDPHAFWTGYFTSRPTKKFMERHGNNFLQVCKQLFSLAALTPEESKDVTIMREAMGILQHHDAITGTEKAHVARDYQRILSNGFQECGDVTEKALLKLTKKNTLRSIMAAGPPVTPNFKSCLALNTSQCEISERSKRFVVTVYNPLAQRENTYVRVPVQKGSYTVRDPQGQQQKIQLVPIPQATIQIPGRVLSPATFELLFHAEHLPPLGFRSYYVEQTSQTSPADDCSTEPVDTYKIGFTRGVGVEVDSNTGLLKKVIKDGASLDIKQNFLYYPGALGDNRDWDKRSSGAYIFRPNGTEQVINSNVSFKVYKGDLVEEIHQVYSPWVSQVIRTYANEKHVELVWQVGPIPIEDGKGKEVISRFESPLQSKGAFFTDSNGRELLKRQRDFRPTWTVNLQEKVSGNYYPITSRISLRDAAKKQSMGILVDRAEGGSSLQDGQLELLVHRRLLHDDAFGVGEALNETAFGKGLVARGTHVLFAGEEGSALGRRTLAAQERLLARRLLLRSWLFFTDATDISFDDWQKKYTMEFVGLTQSLPHNIHLMTLEPWKGKSLLVRLENFFEKNEDHELSKPSKVNLQTFLKPIFNVVSARETNLAANKWINETIRLSWKADSNEIEEEEQQAAQPKNSDDFNITLNPMEIRTFIVEVQN